MITRPSFRTLKTYKHLELADAAYDWVYEVIEGRVTEREQTFAAVINTPHEAIEMRSALTTQMQNLLVTQVKDYDPIRAFFTGVFEKMELERKRLHLQVINMPWPTIFTIRWMKRDGLIYWSFYMNATPAGLAVDVRSGDVLSQRDEIDDDLEVFSMTYKPRR